MNTAQQVNALPPLHVRFFIFDHDQDDIVEVDEADFLICEYPMDYKRHTVRENGVSQICLTKMPEG